MMPRVRDEDVFDAVAALVTAGEYLDSIPGKPGVDVEGGGAFESTPDGTLRRLYTRGTPRYLRARDRGWIEPLPPLRPASPAAVAEAEALAGIPLPPLLRRLYLEIGNGGFGPGYGIVGLRDGFAVHPGETALDSLQRRGEWPAGGPAVPMLLCAWGCGITSTVDLADGQIWGSDPNPAPGDVDYSFPQHLTVTDWFARWLEGRLYQPWLVEDPVTGDWRGATDAEYAEMIAEFDDDEDEDDA
jgi:hypothetical protein